ncbi:hypothetical protein JAAARDRAFT_135392, partial [Jaapia argillacea MUCL 33604]
MTVEAVRFIRTFFIPLSSGPLQLYTSALPFLPSKSLMHHIYGHLVDKTAPFVLHGQESTWSPLLLSLEFHQDQITALTFSNDGTHLASGDEEGNIQIWSLETGGIIGSTIQASRNFIISSLALSPDGSHIACGSEGGQLQTWELEEEDLFGMSVIGLESPVMTLTFSLDGTHLASGHGNGIVNIWD